MNLQEALDIVDEWEGEDESQNPTTGSDDDPNYAASLVSIAGYVIYSHLRQGLICSEMWKASDFIGSVQDVIAENAESGAHAYMNWRRVRWEIPNV